MGGGGGGGGGGKYMYMKGIQYIYSVGSLSKKVNLGAVGNNSILF